MPDWRETLFIWRGELIWELEPGCCRWKGTWVGFDDAEACKHGHRLDPDIYSSSMNTFELTGKSSGTGIVWEGGSYLLDNGESLQPYSDMEHRNLFWSEGGAKTITNELESWLDGGGSRPEESSGIVIASVTGMGDTEFGKFRSCGVLEVCASTPSDKRVLNLTIARRYFRDTDARLRSDYESIPVSIRELKTESAVDRGAVLARALPFKLMKTKVRARAKTKDSGGSGMTEADVSTNDGDPCVETIKMGKRKAL
jgi:hypothetical protein